LKSWVEVPVAASKRKPVVGPWLKRGRSMDETNWAWAPAAATRIAAEAASVRVCICRSPSCSSLDDVERRPRDTGTQVIRGERDFVAGSEKIRSRSTKKKALIRGLSFGSVPRG
jgi:hypothetical protein